MGIEAKDIQVLLWRVLKFSIDTCSRFVQKYPFFSGVLLFLLFLYLYFPSVFFFLVYSSPFLFCTAVFIHFYLDSQRPNIQNAVEDEKMDHAVSSEKSESQAADLLLNRDDNSSIQVGTMLQRNVVEEKNEVSATQEVEKNSVLLTTLNDHFIDRTSLIEEKPKGVTVEKENYSSNPGKISSRNVSIGESISALGEASTPDLMTLHGLNKQAAKLHGAGEVELESSSSEEDDDEEEAQEGGTKAVEWNEDDQKNLMDLGISELERNRRLESLIARHRARKLSKMNAEKSLINFGTAPPGSMAPVLVMRSNPFDFPDGSDEQIPGSAPSILLPTQNPFDLPYDPLEEKPNLMEDSFNREFLAAHQREMLFCRHESFSLGPFFPLEGMQDQHEGPRYATFKRHLGKGDHDRFVDDLLTQGGETLRHNLSVTDLVTQGQSSNQVTNKLEQDSEARNIKIKMKGEQKENAHEMKSSLGKGNERQMEADAIKHRKSEFSPSSSSEDSEQNFSAKRNNFSEDLKPTVFKFPEVFRKPAQNSLHCPIPKARVVTEPSHDSSPSTIDKTRIEDHLLFTDKGPWHTPNNSIASDMQVEVSEVGSPPLTVDGTVSSGDEDSLTYDGDIEKELTSGSDEMWGASPYAPRVEEHEITSREVNKVSQEDITEGFSGVRKEPDRPKSSSMKPLSLSRSEIPQDGQAQSMNFDHRIINNLKQVVEEAGEGRPSSDTTTPVNTLEGVQLMEDLADHTSHEVHLQMPQESLNPSEKPAEEVNISYNVDDSVYTHDDVENLKSTEDGDGRAEKSIMQEVVGNPSEPAEKSKIESRNLSEFKSLNSPERSAEDMNISSNADDPVVHINDHMEDLKPTEDNEKDSEKLTEHEGSHNISMQVEDGDNKIQTQDSREDQITIEVGVSGMYESSADPTTSSAQPELMVEQVSANSSSSSSPKSVLPGRIPIDQRSLSNFNQQLQTDVSESDLEESIVRNNSLNLSETVVPNAPQNAWHVQEYSRDHPSIDSNARKSEEPTNSVGKSTDKANEIYSTNESGFDNEEDKEDLKSIKSETLIGNEATAKEEESTNLPRKFVEEVSVGCNVSDPSENEKENLETLSSVKGNEGESQVSIAQETPLQPLKPADVNSLEGFNGSPRELTKNEEPFVVSSDSIEENDNTNNNRDIKELEKLIQHEQVIDLPKPAVADANAEATKDVQGESEDIIAYRAAINPSKPAVESYNIDNTVTIGGENTTTAISHNVNDLLANEMSRNEKFKLVGDSIGESQRLDRQEDIMEPSKATEVTNSESIKDHLTEFKKFSEDEVNVVPSQPGRESSSSNDIKSTKDPGKSIVYENVMNKSNQAEVKNNLKTSEDVKGKPKNLIEEKIEIDESTIHKIIDEPTKPWDFEVKDSQTRHQ